jgi:hypothetical protein
VKSEVFYIKWIVKKKENVYALFCD